MKHDRPRVLINALALAALGVSLLAPDTLPAAALILLCLLCALAVLYRNLPRLSGVSEDNPKLRSVRQATVMTVAAVIVIAAYALGTEYGLLTPSEAQLKLFLSLLLSALMMLFGNLAPKLPFNRYTGLRLPWTIRDEDTWIVAHRILGYLSFPLGMLTLAGPRSPLPMDAWMQVWFAGPLLVWIGVPALLSGLFFWRKWRRLS